MFIKAQRAFDVQAVNDGFTFAEALSRTRRWYPPESSHPILATVENFIVVGPGKTVIGPLKRKCGDCGQCPVCDLPWRFAVFELLARCDDFDELTFFKRYRLDRPENAILKYRF